MPAFSARRRFIPTYVTDAGSSPASTVTRHGGRRRDRREGSRPLAGRSGRSRRRARCPPAVAASTQRSVGSRCGSSFFDEGSRLATELRDHRAVDHSADRDVVDAVAAVALALDRLRDRARRRRGSGAGTRCRSAQRRSPARTSCRRTRMPSRRAGRGSRRVRCRGPGPCRGRMVMVICAYPARTSIERHAELARGDVGRPHPVGARAGDVVGGAHRSSSSRPGRRSQGETR